MVDGFVVGCRVRETGDGNARGTVRYIGPVAAAKNKTEAWLGVEWDQERGRHDGSCVDDDGVLHRYFQCVNGFGSFVKPSKVTAGTMLITALRERYVGLDAPEIAGPDSLLPDAFVVTAKGHQKGIEFVGERKLRKWQQIEDAHKVALRNTSVSTIGAGIAEVASHVTEVDLQDNLLWRWDEVASLTTQLPGLATLMLHGNKMQQLTAATTQVLPAGCFQGLRVLALNGCDLQSWAEVEVLEPLLPAVEELYLTNNSLPDIPGPAPEAEAEAEAKAGPDAGGGGGGDTPETVFALPRLPPAVGGFPMLRLLDLSACGLHDWHQVLAFRALPQLRELALDGNPLPSVLPCPPGGFPALQRFSVSSSKLASWADVDALATYAGCRVLRLSQVPPLARLDDPSQGIHPLTSRHTHPCPLFKVPLFTGKGSFEVPLFTGKGSSEVRPIVIGRIKQLQFFNGSGVGPRERTDAEKAYLRSIMYALEDAQAAGATLDVAALHPRHAELQGVHGADMLPMGKAAAGDSLAANLISVTLKNLSFGSGGSLEPTTKKLPTSLTVGRLRLMVKQLFGLDPPLQHLSIRVYKDALPTFLDDDMATIGYYGALDGAEVYINEAKA